jgi:hypothetical protein
VLLFHRLQKVFSRILNCFEIYQFFPVIISEKFTEGSTSGMYIPWFSLKANFRIHIPVHLSFGELNNRNSEFEITTGIVYKCTDSVVNHKSQERRYFPLCIDITFKSGHSFLRRKKYL